MTFPFDSAFVAPRAVASRGKKQLAAGSNGSAREIGSAAADVIVHALRCVIEGGETEIVPGMMQPRHEVQ